MDPNGPRFSVGNSSQASLEEYLAVLDSIEEEPYDDLYVFDHAMKKNVYSWLTLAADRTDQIRVGPGVTNPYSRNPGLTAAALGTLNEISDGRTFLGIGAGGHGVGPFGYAQDKPIGAIRVAVDTIRRLLAGETVSVDTPAFTIEEGALEFTPPVGEIPVYIAGRGPQLLKLAGEIGDGAVAGAGLSTAPAMEYARRQVEKGATEADRDPDDVELRCWTFLSIADNHETAIEAVAPFVANLANSHAPRRMMESFGLSDESIERIKAPDDLSHATTDEALEALTQEVIDLFAITGTPEECRERVMALHEADVEHISVVPFPNDENGRLETLDVFSAEVIEWLYS